MQSHQDTITRLWTAARAMFARLSAAVGETAAIAAREALSAAERRAIRAWLRPLEAMVRKTVLIQAIALARRGDIRPPSAPPKQRGSSEPAHACARKRPPALTLVALPPPPVRIVKLAPAHAAAGPPPAPQRTRAASLRLWPRQRRSAGPRVRKLCDATVADIARSAARLALSRHLNRVRLLRAPEPKRLARRIGALERLIARPLAAARRLARRLIALPGLALKLACKPAPRTRLYDNIEIMLANIRAHADACAFQPDTS
jgi:hypothetical protein